MTKLPENDKPKIPGYANFMIGGGAGVLARFLVHPADLIKTRMQLAPKTKKTSMINMIRSKNTSKSLFSSSDESFAEDDKEKIEKRKKHSDKAGEKKSVQIVAKDGVIGLYAGISAAIFRQSTYTTARFGFFNLMFDYHKEKYGVPGFGMKLILGLVSGGLSAFIGNPGEVVLVRMTADGQLPPEQRRNYNNVFNALTRMIREEGVTALWRGTSSTIVRAMIVNAAQLSTYAEARELFLPSLGEGVPLHFSASVVAGLVTSITSLPIDIVKTRVQNAKGGASQVKVFFNIIKFEGPLALWNGFIPTFAKVGPHTVFTFMFFEQLAAIYIRLTTKVEKP